MIRRTPQQVAKRTLVLGAIAFRASLEVTDHPRAVELSLQLVPWLSKLGCADELDPLERELLETPLRKLSGSQKIDANWSGEEAAFFCWSLGLADPLPVTSPADQSDVLKVLPILRPEAAGILRQPLLRNEVEIEAACVQTVLIRSLLQESRIGKPASETVRRVNLNRLAEAGLNATDEDLRRAVTTVERMTPQERSRAAGFSFIRDHAALWLFSDRPTYFESPTE